MQVVGLGQSGLHRPAALPQVPLGHQVHQRAEHQPGVEQGKKYTYGLMGRAGYEKDAEEVGEWFGKIAADSVEAF